MGHDSGFRINFLSYYKSLVYAWNPVVNFGVDWQLYKGFLLTQLPEFIGTIITGSWGIGQRMIMVFWFIAIQASMYVLVQTIKPEKEHWVFRLSASIFYAFNFYILQAWFIVERAKFSLYAALPLSILLFYQVFEKKKSISKFAVLFGLLYFFANGGGSPPLYGATILVWFITIVYFSLIHWKERRIEGLLLGLRVAVFFGFAFLLMNAYWIIPQVGLYLSTYKAAVTQLGGIDGLIAWERTNSKNASIVNLLRLQGIPDWYDNPSNPFARTFLHNFVLIVASFLPIFTICAGFGVSLFKKVRHNSLVYLALFLLAVGLLFGGGSHPPFGILFEYAMRHVQGFAIFRSSFYKFGPLVWFSIIFLFAYFIDVFLSMFRNHKRTQLFVGVCIITGILLYHYPFFTANIFQFDKFFSTKIRVPDYVQTMTTYANNHTDPNARIMLLPELSSSFYGVQMDSYSWKFFSLDILPRNAIDRSIIANDNNAPDVIFRLYSEFMDGSSAAFTKLAGYAGIRYILWRNDALYSRSVVDGRTIEFQKNRLASFHLNKIFQAGEWELYDLGQQIPAPLVWTPQQIAVTGQPIADPLDYVLTAGPTSAVFEGTELPENVIEATCVYCEPGVYDKMVRETPQPSLRYQPGSPLFSRLLTADSQAIGAAGSNPEALFNALMSHAQLQLAILASPVKPKEYDERTIVADIQQSFATARKQIDILSGRQKNVYMLRLLLYIDVSDRFYPGIHTFSLMRDELKPLVWMTENTSDIRYEFITTKEAEYTATVTNVNETPVSIDIDGVTYTDYRGIHIQPGYHTARIVSPATTRGFAPQLFLTKQAFIPVPTPVVTFTHINSTTYIVRVAHATVPFVLVLNEAFDSRWKVKLAGNSAYVDENTHGKSNGFGNAWNITKTGEYTLEIDYTPQHLFVVGAVLSLVGIAAGIILLFHKNK